MYNNSDPWVDRYCDHFGLEVIRGVNLGYVVENDNAIAEFRNDEITITFFADDNPTYTMKKSDLCMFILENVKVC